MDRFQGDRDLVTSSLATFRRAVVVGCAMMLLSWQFLPRSPACRVVTVSFPASIATHSGQAANAREASVRRWLIPVDSPQLKHLEELAAEMQRTSARRLPPEYYAEQWRIEAAQYYYERELQRERLAAADSEPSRLALASTTAIAAVSFQSPLAGPNSAAVGSRYWQWESREAQARQRALLAGMPAPRTVQRPTVRFGSFIPGRPVPLWTAAAVVMGAFAGIGMLWLQRITHPAAAPAEIRPLMQLHVPHDWVRQSPTRGRRLVKAVVVIAWLVIFGCLAAFLR